MNDKEIEDCFSTTVDLAKEVGKIIHDAFYQEKKIEHKSNFADLVTETDQLVEKTIISTLRDKYPTHSFIGEESAADGIKSVLTDNPTWVIDPVDGTTNFVHRFPFVAVSIGLLVNKEPVLGVVYNPILNEMYTAKKGQGSYCNGKKLQVTKTEELKNALICAEFGTSRDKKVLDSKFQSIRNVVERSHGFRQLGSAALHMCGVARATHDAHFSLGIHIWDMAAAMLVVLEAGGVIHDVTGGPLDLLSRRMLCAGTEKLAKEISTLVSVIEYERD